MMGGEKNYDDRLHGSVFVVADYRCIGVTNFFSRLADCRGLTGGNSLPQVPASHYPTRGTGTRQANSFHWSPCCRKTPNYHEG